MVRSPLHKAIASICHRRPFHSIIALCNSKQTNRVTSARRRSRTVMGPATTPARPALSRGSHTVTLQQDDRIFIHNVSEPNKRYNRHRSTPKQSLRKSRKSFQNFNYKTCLSLDGSLYHHHSFILNTQRPCFTYNYRLYFIYLYNLLVLYF